MVLLYVYIPDGAVELGVVGVVVGTKISVLGGGVVVAASQSHG